MREELFVKKIDTHAHLMSDELYPHLDEIIMRAKSAGVTAIVNINTDRVTMQRALALSDRYKGFLFHAAATTPHDVLPEGELYFEEFVAAARGGELVAIGESGLDYYYEHSPRELQQHFFKRYLQLAKEVNLPLVIHCRGDEAFVDLFKIASSVDFVPAVLHCFTGNLEQAQEAVKRGWRLSLSGILTFKKSAALREVVKEIPMEHLLIETDAPYLAPEPYRGRVNESAFVVQVAHTIAQIKEISVEEVCRITYKNSCDFFHLSDKLISLSGSLPEGSR